MKAALEQFAVSVQQKFTATVKGEPEDQLRAPFERLLQEAGEEAGFDVQPIGETRLKKGGGKPDFGISVGNLLCGHAEFKALGRVRTRPFTPVTTKSSGNASAKTALTATGFTW